MRLPLSRRARLSLALAAAVLAALAALTARRGPWSPDDFRDARDAVAEHERLALSPGHAALLGSGAAGCTACHISHSARPRRALWGGDPAAGPERFAPESPDAGGGGTGMCLSCHDGSTARALSAHAGPAYGTEAAPPGLGGAHPVGIDYRAAARRAPESFRAPESNPRIVLEDGKVGCVSCHATHDAAVVAAGTVRPEVCVECHVR